MKDNKHNSTISGLQDNNWHLLNAEVNGTLLQGNEPLTNTTLSWPGSSPLIDLAYPLTGFDQSFFCLQVQVIWGLCSKPQISHQSTTMTTSFLEVAPLAARWQRFLVLERGVFCMQA